MNNGNFSQVLYQIRQYRKVGVSVADEEFHCYGTFGPMHKGRPNEKDIKAAIEFAKIMKDESTKENL